MQHVPDTSTDGTLTHVFNLCLDESSSYIEDFFNEIFEHNFFSSNTVHTIKDFNGNLRNIYPLNLGIINYLFYSKEEAPFKILRSTKWLDETIYQVLRDTIIGELIEVIKKAKSNQPIYKGIIRNSLPIVGLWLHDMGLPTLSPLNKSTMVDKNGTPIKVQNYKIKLCKYCLDDFPDKVPLENLHPQTHYAPGCKGLYKDDLRDTYEPKANLAYESLKKFYNIILQGVNNIPAEDIEHSKKLIRTIKELTRKIASLLWFERIKSSVLDCNFYIPFSDVSHIKTQADLENDKHKDTFAKLTEKQEEAIKAYLAENTDSIKRLIELLKEKTGRQLQRAEAKKLFNIYTRGSIPL